MTIIIGLIKNINSWSGKLSEWGIVRVGNCPFTSNILHYLLIKIYFKYLTLIMYICMWVFGINVPLPVFTVVQAISVLCKLYEI